MLQTLVKDALKEWAVAIRALDEGRQVVLLRKGGVREKEFKLEHDEFLLYPTFEHQKPELLKPEYQDYLAETLAPWGGEPPKSAPDTVTFTHLARVREVLEITEPELLERLSPYYIWTTNYAEGRLHWRPRKPLEVLLVQAYRLDEPVTVPVEPYFVGCKSWVDLPSGVPLGGLTPVISDREFATKAQQIREVLR